MKRTQKSENSDTSKKLQILAGGLVEAIWWSEWFFTRDLVLLILSRLLLSNPGSEEDQVVDEELEHTSRVTAR